MRWVLLALLLSPLAHAGTLAVVVTGKVTTWDDGTPIPADQTVYIRLYGAAQGAVKTLKDSAPTADRLSFRRPDSSDVTTMYCYEAAAAVDQNGDKQIQPEEEGLRTMESCGRYAELIVIRRPAMPAGIAVESPAP